MLIAQITDTHIVAPGKLFMDTVDTAAALERAVTVLNRLTPVPDVVVLTGDLVESGEAMEYAHLRSLLAPLRIPLFAIPGNHDARDAMRDAFFADGYLPQHGFLNYVIEDYQLRIIALDTLVPGEGGGLLCPDRLRWLQGALAAAPGRPTVVMMHHPPFATGIARMDRAGLAGTAAFAEIVGHHPQIERILCGHLHRAIDSRFAGTIAGTAPSTAHQVALDLRPDARLSFTLEPPGYQLHYWREGLGLVTHTANTGEWPGPFPYSKSVATG
jgi:3',5'-cyclic AMP phosphodiesterase CpdA